MKTNTILILILLLFLFRSKIEIEWVEHVILDRDIQDKRA
jgi:hypothetical protein